MRAREFIHEINPGVNRNTARSIAADIHGNLDDLQFHVRQYGRDRYYQRVWKEVEDMVQDLANLGWQYDPDSADHMRPMTVTTQPDAKLSEAPLPPKAQQVLWRLKHGLDQPGIQLSRPTPGPQQPKQADPEPVAPTQEPLQIAGPTADPADYRADFINRAEYPRLKAQIQRLERLQAQFVELERLIDRAERQPGGIDRGTAADLEIIRNWPVPETDEEIGAYAAKIGQGLEIMRQYLQRKRAVWR